MRRSLHINYINLKQSSQNRSSDRNFGVIVWVSLSVSQPGQIL